MEEAQNQNVENVVQSLDRVPSVVASYGLLVINHAYNEGKITFKEWLELTKEWVESMIEKYGVDR